MKPVIKMVPAKFQSFVMFRARVLFERLHQGGTLQKCYKTILYKIILVTDYELLITNSQLTQV